MMNNKKIPKKILMIDLNDIKTSIPNAFKSCKKSMNYFYILKKLTFNPFDKKEPDHNIITEIKRYSRLNAPRLNDNVNNILTKVKITSLALIFLLLSLFFISNLSKNIEIFEYQFVNIDHQYKIITEEVLSEDEMLFYYAMMHMK